MLDRSAVGRVYLSYNAEPVKVSVLSRLRGDHVPSDLTTDFNSPSYYQGYTQSTIAAGHKGAAPHEHEADLALEILHATGWGNWGSVGNVKMTGVLL
jgi:hypothetical protein